MRENFRMKKSQRNTARMCDVSAARLWFAYAFFEWIDAIHWNPLMYVRAFPPSFCSSRPPSVLDRRACQRRVNNIKQFFAFHSGSPFVCELNKLSNFIAVWIIDQIERSKYLIQWWCLAAGERWSRNKTIEKMSTSICWSDVKIS